MNPFDTKFHEPFDTYWRCPHCHYSCNGDMSPTNWHAILSNETDWYAQQCITYKDILSQYIHFGMDKVNGMQLIQKFHDEFLAMSNILRNNLKSMLERPSNQSFQVRFNTAYGVTEYEFAKSCIMIEQYKPAALYIGQAMKYVPSSHSSFSMIAELSEEITQKNQELLASKASHEISSLPPHRRKTTLPAHQTPSPQAAWSSWSSYQLPYFSPSSQQWQLQNNVIGHEP